MSTDAKAQSKKEQHNATSRFVQTLVTALGLTLWAGTIFVLATRYTPREQLVTLALVPVITLFILLVNTFPTDALKFTRHRFTFTPSDSVILLAICWLGFVPAVIVSGIEGFVTSRRTVKRLSSNLFSSAMMALATAAAAYAVAGVLRYGFAAEPGGAELPFIGVAVAMLVGGLSHITVNIGLLSAVYALRQRKSFLRTWREMLTWVAPMFLPTGTIATLLYIALQYNLLVTIVIAVPVIAAIFLAQRQYRNSVQERMDMMEKAHRETIEALAVTINAKDEVTHEHVQRVQVYATGVARILGCTDQEIEALKAGALLHDVGKIAVPDYILNKPGKLTKEEFDKMKSHTVVGAKILGRVEFPYPVVPIVRSHHERWDGKGYPDGLIAEQIPLTARILSVVDCFDAVREDRPYRRGMTRDEAIELLLQGSGTQYDPRVVGTFVTHLPEFEAEVAAQRGRGPVPTFGIEPAEELSQTAKEVAPAAGLAEPANAVTPSLPQLKHKDLQLLYALAGRLNGVRDRAGIIAACEAVLPELLAGETLALTLAEHAGDYRTALACGECGDYLRGRAIGVGEGVTGWVLANRRPFMGAKPTLDVPASAEEAFGEYKTLAAYPVQKGKDLHGALTLYSRSLAEYTPEHERLMSEAATLIAAALSAIDAPAIEPAASSRAAAPNAATKHDSPLVYTDASAVGDAIESGMTH